MPEFEKGSELEAKLAAMQARAEITDLAYTYARNVRTGRGKDCRPLLTDDAVFEMWMFDREDPTLRLRNRQVGADAMVRYIVESTTESAWVCPMVHNLLIELNGDTASSTCVLAALLMPGARELVGEYRDTYRYEGRWRFSSRIYTMLIDRSPA